MKTEHHIFNCITSRICLTDVICTSHCLFKYIRRKQKQYLRNGFHFVLRIVDVFSVG